MTKSIDEKYKPKTQLDRDIEKQLKEEKINHYNKIRLYRKRKAIGKRSEVLRDWQTRSGIFEGVK